MPDAGAMADASSHDRPTPPQPKRPRPVISCLECRRKKLKCDRTHPCQQCVRIGRPGRCEYQTGQEPQLNPAYSPAAGSACKRPRIEREHPLLVDDANASDLRDAIPDHLGEGRSGHSSAPAERRVIEDLQERVARLEQALLRQDQQRSGSHRSAATSHSPPCPSPLIAYHNGDEGDLTVNPRTNPRFPEACTFLQKLQNDLGDPDMARLRADLKRVHMTIELVGQRLHYGSTVTAAPSGNQNQHHRQLDLPPYHVCKKLAVIYFGNLEHCFRILHWPEFRDQLKVFFTEGLGEKACAFGFTPQLIGVLAIAANLGTHPECDAAAAYPILQQPNALKFINDFLRGLRDRQRYLLPALQVKMLVLMVRWIGMEPIDDLLRLAGELTRDALIMKLDQDPSTLPGVSIFQGELRRRCWMTIVEGDLMLSILCKLPCMVPPYTSRPPQNVDDDELYEGMAALPPSRPLEDWTDGLCQYVLAQSFPRRLEACKQMDSCSPGHVKFRDVLAHTRYLERVLQELPPPLRFSYRGDQESKTPPRLMARMELDISIRRPLMHLYSCCASAPNADDIQQEARAGFLQSCLMLTTFQDLFDPQFSEINVPRPQGYWDFFHNVYRHELGQAILGLCFEIKRLSCASETHRDGIETNPTSQAATPIHETPNNNNHSSNGVALTSAPAPAPAPAPTPASGRPPALAYRKDTMIAAVKDILDPMKRRLVHPGANFKDIVYFTVVLTSVLPGRQSKERLIQQALQNLVRDCNAQLEREREYVPSTGNDNDNIFAQVPDSDSGPYRSQHASSPGPQAPLGPKFDPTWADFPDLDFFDSAGSYERVHDSLAHAQ